MPEVVNANREVWRSTGKESAREENGRGRDTKKATLKTEKKNQQEDKARKRQRHLWSGTRPRGLKSNRSGKYP